MSYKYLFDLALILISTKLFGLFTRKIQMPQVVGALIAGLVFGPAMLDVLHETEFLTQLAELGVIVIMFSAGMGTSLKDLKKSGSKGFVVALFGVLVPLGAGTLVGWLFTKGQPDANMLNNVFIGVVLTATSVSITVETLRELGKLSTKVGNIILAAAIIDDILGLVALTLVTSMAGSDVNIWMVLLKIVLFFVFAVVAGVGVQKLFNWYADKKGNQNLHRYPVVAFVICLVYAFLAEEVFGIADIIGAFAAGLVIANTSKGSYISLKFQPVQYLFLTPVFFASIGIKVELPEMNMQLLLLSICIVAAAILAKLVGCGAGARICGCTTRESVQIGFGMACRGEVALIVANKGLAMGLMPQEFFGPIIIMVVCCAVFAPVFLKAAFRKKPGAVEYDDLARNAIGDRYDEHEQMEIFSDQILSETRRMQTDDEEEAKPERKRKIKK